MIKLIYRKPELGRDVRSLPRPCPTELPPYVLKTAIANLSRAPRYPDPSGCGPVFAIGPGS